MKVKISVDCTPEEARRFFGLPDVGEVQQEAVAALSERLRSAIAEGDLDALAKTWMPSAVEGWENWGKMFWDSAPKSGKSKRSR